MITEWGESPNGTRSCSLSVDDLDSDEEGGVARSTISAPPKLSAGSSNEDEQDDSIAKRDGEIEQELAELDAMSAAEASDPSKLSTGSGLNGDTTVAIRGLPRTFTQQQLMEEINEMGFEGRYDFFYVPLERGQRSNRGFAFVNFVSTEVAEEFYQQMHNKNFDEPTKSVVQVMPAKVQGFEQNAMRFAGLRDPQRRKRQFYSWPMPSQMPGFGNACPSEASYEEAWDPNSMCYVPVMLVDDATYAAAMQTQMFWPVPYDMLNIPEGEDMEAFNMSESDNAVKATEADNAVNAIEDANESECLSAPKSAWEDRFCPSCGEWKLLGNFKFCHACGCCLPQRS